MQEEVLSVVKSEWEWKIENFSLITGFYISPDITFAGENWFVTLLDDFRRHLMLRLKKKTSNSPIEVEFSASLKITEGTKFFERRCRRNEQGYYDITQWISVSEFKKKQREFLSFGCLTIVLTLKRADSGVSEIDNVASACSCCKGSLRGERIAFHKECLNTAVKCPRCDKVINLLQNWCDHECQAENVKDESGPSQPSKPQPKEKILHDFKQLFLSQENCDVILRVQGQEFSAHQAILVARSPVFACTFRSNMKEKETGTLDIEDVDAFCFPEFLCFLYCGELDKLSAENVRSLFTAADKYQIMELRSICLTFMKENLCADTFCETLTLALLHSESELINSCTDYFVRNADEIIETVQWQTFVDENPTQSNELFIKYVKSTKKSNK